MAKKKLSIDVVKIVRREADAAVRQITEPQLRRPPLGLSPHLFYEEKRALEAYKIDLVRMEEIKAAIKRYRAAKKEVPADWLIQRKIVKDRINQYYAFQSSINIARNSRYGVFGMPIETNSIYGKFGVKIQQATLHGEFGKKTKKK